MTADIAVLEICNIILFAKGAVPCNDNCSSKSTGRSHYYYKFCQGTIDRRYLYIILFNQFHGKNVNQKKKFFIVVFLPVAGVLKLWCYGAIEEVDHYLWSPTIDF